MDKSIGVTYRYFNNTYNSRVNKARDKISVVYKNNDRGYSWGPGNIKLLDDIQRETVKILCRYLVNDI